MRKKKSRADMRTDNRKFSPRAMEAFTNLVFAAHELSVRIPLDYHGNSLEEMKQWEMKLTEKSKDELKEFLYEIVMDRYKTGNRDLNIFTDLLEEFPNYDEVNNQIHESGSLHKVIKEWVVHLEPNDRVRLFVYQERCGKL
jgi:hypothetical protein